MFSSFATHDVILIGAVLLWNQFGETIRDADREDESRQKEFVWKGSLLILTS